MKSLTFPCQESKILLLQLTFNWCRAIKFNILFLGKGGRKRRKVKEPQIKLYNLKDRGSVCLSLASHNDSPLKRRSWEEVRDGFRRNHRQHPFKKGHVYLISRQWWECLEGAEPPWWKGYDQWDLTTSESVLLVFSLAQELMQRGKQIKENEQKTIKIEK